MRNKTTFVIGDIQGCYTEFRKLLKIIDPYKKNNVFCVGDIVNRGPHSEKVVDYVIDNKIQSVLGNHDLHMMAMVLGVHKKNDKKHTLQKLLNKNKSLKVFEYFLKFPFAKLIEQGELKTLVTHAGILPSWSLNDVIAANEELTQSLQADPEKFLSYMYSERSKDISKSTNKRNRARFLVNVFTRMRFITKRNKLDLLTKVKTTSQEKYKPWFLYDHKCLKEVNTLVFGHWASLNGVTNHNEIKGVDLGCVWGGSLAAINLNDKSIITVESEI